jgi:mannose-6-phosphate isomerase-like protein (cupin superfamily)
VVESGRTIDLGDGFTVTVKVDADALTVLETTEPPGLSPPVHIHHDCAEGFYVLDGEYVVHLDGTDTVCGPGESFFVPQGAPHTFRTGESGGRKLNIYVPGAMLGYFEDLAAALAAGMVDDAGLASIAAAHSMEIVGPPPDRYI